MGVVSMSDRKLGMRHVASLAGVSHQTVSRVINGHPNIKQETRDRVLQVIESVNYRPNSAARALASRRSNRIGVLVDSAMEYGPNSTLRAIEDVARARGFTVSSIAVSEGRSISAHAATEHLMSQGIDALCVIAPRESSVDLLRELSDGLPTLVIKASPDKSFLTVSVDQHMGATLAVDHLIALGHRDILHVAGPLDWLDARARERGWRERMQEERLPVREPVIGDWTADFGYAFARSLGSSPECTGVFAGNDQMALGILHGFNESGVRVPEDVSVVGFDDIPEARHFLPPLTTVRQDFHAVGRRSIESLLAAVRGDTVESRLLIEPELIVRRSTGAPRSS